MFMEKTSNLNEDPGNLKNSMDNKGFKKSMDYIKDQSQSSYNPTTTHKLVKEKKESFNSNPDKESDDTGKKFCTILLMVVFFLAFVGSSIAFVVVWFTETYNDSIVQNLILKNNTKALDWWIKPPIEPLLKVHIFNYTNTEEYLSGKDKKLKLVDIGPYTYKERVEKVRVVYEDNKITYNENRTQFFQPSMSNNLNENDKIIVPNVPVIAALPHINNVVASWTFSSVLQSTSSGEFKSLTEKDFIWGYSDNFLTAIKTLMSLMGDTSSLDLFGMLKARKGVSVDNLTTFTGEDSLRNLGRLYAVNGETSLNMWDSEQCDAVNGSDGSQFPPHLLDKEHKLNIFIRSFCRNFPLIFDKEVTVLNGIPAFRYKPPKNVFSVPSINPENQCYCTDENCPPEGTFNSTRCSYNVLMFISFPHFYLGDPKLSESFEGLNPNEKEHGTYADIHSRLAFPINGASRFQINIQLKKNKMVSRFSQFPDNIILPLCWLEFTSGEIPEELMQLIYHTTFSANFMFLSLQYGSLICVLVSAILLLLTSYCFLIAQNRRLKDQLQLETEQNIMVAMNK